LGKGGDLKEKMRVNTGGGRDMVVMWGTGSRRKKKRFKKNREEGKGETNRKKFNKVS